jgi:hypothetical protein
MVRRHRAEANPSIMRSAGEGVVAVDALIQLAQRTLSHSG